MTTAATSSLRTTWGPRISRFGPTRLIGLVAAVLGFGYLWFWADGRLPEASVWQVPLILQLLLLSLPWRTVSARTVLRFFLIGVGPIFLATVLTQRLLAISPLHGWMTDLSRAWALEGIGSLGDPRLTVWAPITEEIWKVVPLFWLLRWGRSHLGTQAGPLDFAILAAAVGAGLGFTEDLFQVGSFVWTTPQSPLLGLGVGTVYVAAIVNTLNRFPTPVFDFDPSYAGLVGILQPSVEQLSLGPIWAGHGGLPLLVGLGIGFAVLGRRRFGTPLVWAVPILGLLWAIWDHFIANWYSFARCERADAPTLCGFTQVDFVGGLQPLVAIVGWGLAMFVSQRIVAAVRADPALALARPQLSIATYRGTGATWPIRYLGDLLHWLVLRGRSAFGWFNLQHATPETAAAQADALVAARLQAGVLSARLRNQAVPELPARAARRIARLTSRI